MTRFTDCPGYAEAFAAIQMLRAAAYRAFFCAETDGTFTIYAVKL